MTVQNNFNISRIGEKDIQFPSQNTFHHWPIRFTQLKCKLDESWKCEFTLTNSPLIAWNRPFGGLKVHETLDFFCTFGIEQPVMYDSNIRQTWRTRNRFTQLVQSRERLYFVDNIQNQNNSQQKVKNVRCWKYTGLDYCLLHFEKFIYGFFKYFRLEIKLRNLLDWFDLPRRYGLIDSTGLFFITLQNILIIKNYQRTVSCPTIF